VNALRIAEGQANGELDAKMDTREAAGFVLMTMQSLQPGAPTGVDAKTLRTMARFAIERLKARCRRVEAGAATPQQRQ
jgi:hypothetical protein